MSEQCQRCKSVGADRRSLWMACFYAMDEMPVPFEAVRIPLSDGKNSGTFFTLRVCKRCRAEWMAAIEAWFKADPYGDDHDADEPADTAGVGSGIFVREHGTIREVTREEWDRTHPGLEPVVFRKDT